MADNEYVFYDGPPFANGLPHYGHLLTGFVKDAVPRYQTMRGRRVERPLRMGLPRTARRDGGGEGARGLGPRPASPSTASTASTTTAGPSCQRTTDAWERYVTRQARWVDFANDYKTMDLPYMESVMWAFKRLWDKGLLYEGDRVLPYCWECETPLSNFETRQDDAYRARQDPAVTVAFELDADPSDDRHRGARARSPPRVDHHAVDSAVQPGPGRGPRHRVRGLRARSAAALRSWPSAGGAYPELFDEAEPAGHGHGRANCRSDATARCSPFFADAPGRLPGARRRTSSPPRKAPGVVHMAPGFGEEDHCVCEAAGISVVCPVDDQARFTAEVPPYAGLQVFDANAPIIAATCRPAGRWWTSKPYTHSYPHCWRTDTPLIYKAVSSWFVEVTAIKDRMLEPQPADRLGPLPRPGRRLRQVARRGAGLVHQPEPLLGLADPGVEERRPRAIPASTSTASPGGARARLRGRGPRDLHRPGIDELDRVPTPTTRPGVRPCGASTDVLDCWFESGSMPFAQVHYPFEHAEWFESHFPADFIVEYVGQTRGWFYTLHVLATALFDCPPFRHCIATASCSATTGARCPSAWATTPSPSMVFDTWGADAMRWFLLSSPVLRGQDLVVHAKGIEEVRRQVLNRIWNTWYFLSLYANADGIRRTLAAQTPPGSWTATSWPRRPLYRTRSPTCMDAYDLYGGVRGHHLLPRRPHQLVHPSQPGPVLAAAARPWRARIGQGRRLRHAVHGARGPVQDRRTSVPLPRPSPSTAGSPGDAACTSPTGRPSASSPPTPSWWQSMDLVREVCSSAHAIRKARGLRSRLPLRSLTVATAVPDILAPSRT